MPPIPRRWRHALAAATLGSALAAAPAAQAEVISIDANRNVTTFHNIDFIAVFGWQVNQPLTVDVFRNDQLIGTSTGPTVEVDEGLPLMGALEVNHGPVGAPQPGDCWTNYTPDIMPGDKVVVTQGAQTDSLIIDPISVEKGPFVNADGNVEVQGRATRPNGTPIDIAFLDSGGVLNTSKFRGGPNQLFRTPGTTDGWTMIFDPASPMFAPGRDGREPAGLGRAERLALLMGGEYGMGYGHVAPLPRETQLFEGNTEAPGPALGCEALASESNRVDSLDDSAVNLASGDLAVTGKAMAGTFNDDITQVMPKISDGTTTITAAAVDVTGDVRDWTATFTRAQLDTLVDGPVTVSADYVTAVGPIGGHTKTLAKDVAAPDVTADTAPGEYTGPISVALSAGAGETITYRTDGLPNGANDRAYAGPIKLPFGTTTISARVSDAAGNATDKAFTYTVNAPAAPAPVAVTPLVAPAPGPVVKAPKLKLDALTLTRRVSLRTARRRGLQAVVFAPDEAKYVKVRLLRGRKVIASVVRRVSGDGVMTIALPQTKKARRALRRGIYRLEVTPGASKRNYGATSKRTIRIR